MSNAVFTSTFPQRLKVETSILHQELEDLPLSKAILKEDISTRDYMEYLHRMHDVIKEVETLIFPLLYTELSDLSQRIKTPLLEQDFNSLSYIKTQSAPVFKNLDKQISTAFALGMLYVIEGSTLGGRVIYKHIHKTLGYDNQSGAAYFSGYGEETGLFWKNFMTTLVAYEKNHNTSEKIIEGANYTFQAIKTHFQSESEL
ncbi:biliverdin-producing heme oxygenase [Algoriphagus winogradskyi]|uniref:Heme oxygenase n=1 Tax=Algoriphagus winogradskyi TaxID=237017 RepID=A0ABY1PGU4_9BACT|nr:biliverdin-producing heme oxygenase [Algoriphagus winogradskyi]SMP34089.1 heme oxygenase [Algoriphagus winogradskyi]